MTVTGRAYTPAVASGAPTVNFGIVRVGDVVANRGLSVANGAALTVYLNTAAAGVFNGGATVAATSRNPDMADLSLGSSTVTLTGQVNNLAQAAFQKTSGAGNFTQTITLTGFSFNADDLLGIGTNATLFVRANVIDPGTSVIPLPPAGFLLLGGLAVMGWMGRRRRT